MRYGSVCSGIEAATVAWHPLGWRPAFFSEIEPFPRAVLHHHYPQVPLHGDFTTIEADQYGAIDLLVGGTPCQSFSVAGLRGGLADDRGNLALEFLRLADRTRPRWLVWENVPGVLSSHSHDAPDLSPPEIDLDSDDGPEDGEEVVVEDQYDADEDHSFACFLAGLQELGYGFAYRVLDAQYFGVPQRRRRVFVVGYLGDWRPPASVLFERHSLSGHPAPRRETGQAVAALTANGVGTCGADDNQGQAGHLIAGPLLAKDGRGVHSDMVNFVAYGGNNTSGPIEVAAALNAHGGPHGWLDFESETFIAHTLRGEGFDASEDGTGRGTPLVPVAFDCKGTEVQFLTDGTHPPLRSMGHLNSHSNAGGHAAVAVAFNLRGREDGAQPEIDPDNLASIRVPSYAFAQNTRDEVRLQGGDGEIAGALAADPGMKQTTYVAPGGMAVRRLTPRECERLQGFPDDYTLVPHRGKPAADGPRYKALGNSMAVPVMRWIGERIAAVEAIVRAERRAA